VWEVSAGRVEARTINLKSVGPAPIRTMPLSRHFYALDEVAAALARATTRNDVRETLFWCLELLDSGCAAEAISALFEAWLWQKGPFCLAWWEGAQTRLGGTEISEDDVLLCAYQLSCVPWEQRDASLWTVLAYDGTVDRVTPKTPPLPAGASDLEVYLCRAVCQGRGAAAWRAAESLPWERVCELLGIQEIDYEPLLGFRTPAHDRAIRALAVLSACVPRREGLPTAIPEAVMESVRGWRALEGRKARRIYTIPAECLYGHTVRGTLPWTRLTLVQLNAAEEYLEGCPFWDERIGALAEGAEAREAFYAAYFPDDHPDEWTAAEKAKSHGDGAVPPNEPVNMERYARVHMGRWSRLAWDVVPQGLKEKKTPQEVFAGSAAPLEINYVPLRRRHVVS
jgi:hypothetical protein